MLILGCSFIIKALVSAFVLSLTAPVCLVFEALTIFVNCNTDLLKLLRYFTSEFPVLCLEKCLVRHTDNTMKM